MAFLVLKWTFFQASFLLIWWRLWLLLIKFLSQQRCCRICQNIMFERPADCSMRTLRHVQCRLQGITQLPWALKPIIGLVSDMFPLGPELRTFRTLAILISQFRNSLIVCSSSNLFGEVKRSKVSQDGPSPFKWKRGGYNKSPYMIAATVLGSLALVLIGIVPHSMLSVTMSET